MYNIVLYITYELFDIKFELKIQHKKFLKNIKERNNLSLI